MRVSLLIIFIASASFLFSQNKGAGKVATCQTATIQRDSVLVKLKEYKTQVSLLEAFQKQLQSEFDYRKLEFDTKLKSYQEKESTFSLLEKESIMNELQKLDDELKKFNAEAEQKLMKKEQELLQPMNDKINAAIDAVAQREGFFQVIDKKFVYFSKAVCDATQLVIEEANRSK
jgi:Skp family chaperone for outer membrane proteins